MPLSKKILKTLAIGTPIVVRDTVVRSHYAGKDIKIPKGHDAGDYRAWVISKGLCWLKNVRGFMRGYFTGYKMGFNGWVTYEPEVGNVFETEYGSKGILLVKFKCNSTSNELLAFAEDCDIVFGCEK